MKREFSMLIPTRYCFLFFYRFVAISKHCYLPPSLKKTEALQLQPSSITDDALYKSKQWHWHWHRHCI